MSAMDDAYDDICASEWIRIVRMGKSKKEWESIFNSEPK